METVTNVTNNIVAHNGTNLQELLNGKNPIEKIASGVNTLLRNQQSSVYKTLRAEVEEEFSKTEIVKQIHELLIRYLTAKYNKKKNFFGQRKNIVEYTAIKNEMRELIYVQQRANHWWYTPTSLEGLLSQLRSDAVSKATDGIMDIYDWDTTYAIILTIPKLENKSFEEIVNIVKKAYGTK